MSLGKFFIEGYSHLYTTKLTGGARTDTHWAPPAAAASYTSPADLSAMLVPKSFLMTKG